MRTVVRKKVDSFPNLDQPISNWLPVIEAEDYQRRISNLFKATGEYSYIVVYGDREHFSNIEYFTGFDPRFEESLLVLSVAGHRPTMIVGDEGKAYTDIIKYDMNVEVYPVLGLAGQPSRHDRTLVQVFNKVGLKKGDKVGVIGWKCFYETDFANVRKTFDIPCFIMQALIEVAGEENLFNITDIMIGNKNGLRHNLEAKEFVISEVMSTKSSRNVYRVLQNLQEGIDEVQAGQFLKIGGEPLATHPNVNFGESILMGLASCTPWKKLEHGDLVGVGMSYRRSMCHKVGYYISSESEETTEMRALYDTYFRALTAWYEAIKIGATGGEVYDSVENMTGDLSAFGIGLNPGHLSHTDEWTNSPFIKGNTDKLHSGMAIQCDFTASKNKMAVHAEDGILIADEQLQAEIKMLAPESYKRIMNRRKFMIEVLGIRIAPEVLPTSDIPAVVFPHMCDVTTILANEGE